METITKSQIKRIFSRHDFAEDEVLFIAELMENIYCKDLFGAGENYFLGSWCWICSDLIKVVV
jgi:hypothetical protein